MSDFRSKLHTIDPAATPSLVGILIEWSMAGCILFFQAHDLHICLEHRSQPCEPKATDSQAKADGLHPKG